jgi:hypothetical protein
MQTDRCAKGKRVRVTSYGPFRGLKGTIQCVSVLDHVETEPCYFYLIALDALQRPLCFAHSDVEFLDALPVPVRSCPDFEHRRIQAPVPSDHRGQDALSA